MVIHLITLSILIAAVLLVRVVFRKRVSARLIYALWLVVAVKLCMPFSLFEVELALPFDDMAAQTEQMAVQTQNVPEVTKAPAVTAGAPILSQQPTVSQQIVEPPITPTAPITPIAPIVTEPAIITSIETEAIAPEEPMAVEKAPIDWAHVWRVVWMMGSLLLCFWFTVSGTVFHQKLCADRRLHTTVGKTKVYISQSAGAPCLAGLIPAIYLTPDAARSPSKAFVIAHEYTHLRHGDHIWAALRALALIFYWWNPLVWAAAMVSKQDAELACDEGVAAKLDDAGRLAYARTILDTIPQKYAHAVGLGSAPIKERLLMLTKKHKNRVLAAILAVLLTLSAVGCSFIGPKAQPENTPDLPSGITTTSPDTPQAVTTSAAVADIPDAPESPVRVLSNEGNVEIHTVWLPVAKEDMQYRSFAYNERYSIYLTYTLTRGADSAQRSYQYDSLYIIDAQSGRIVYTDLLDVVSSYMYILYTGYGCTLYTLEYSSDGKAQSVGYTYSLMENDGAFVQVMVDFALSYPYAEQRFVSPDGTYTAYKIVEDAGGDGGIEIQYPNGTAKRILDNIMLEEAADLSAVTGYHPIGFVEDTKLVYRIGGWEGTKGYGIYDLAAGEKTEVFEIGSNPCAVYDGAFYVEEWRSTMIVYEPEAVWKIKANGEKTKIASKDVADGVYVLSDDQYREFENSMWCIFDTGNAAGIVYGEETPETLTVAMYSPDLAKKLCEIEYPHGGSAFDNVRVYGNSVTVVVPYAAEETAKSPVRVLSNEGNLQIRPVYIPAESFAYKIGKYDDDHYLCLTYDRTELEGYKEYTYNNLHVYIIDAKAGTVAADRAIDGSYYLSSMHYTDNGCILYETEEAAFRVVYENGTLTVSKTERPTYPIVSDCPITSADGAYTVYTTEDDLIGAGTMTVRYADGSVKALLRHKNAGDVVGGKTVDMGDVERYHPIGFIDNTRFVYSITGYDCSKGYGVYDLQTGENAKYLQAMSVNAVYDGKVYLTKQAGYETVSWWMCDPDGSDMTMIASVSEEDGVFTLSGDRYNYTYNFKNGVWFFFTEDNTITLYTHDFGQRLAKLEYADSGYLFGNMQVYENMLIIAVPYVADTVANNITIHSLADWDTLNSDGKFPADGNCYELINGLAHFGGKPDLADRYPELGTVKISDYTISRRKDEALLYFDFTVAESGMDTLPVGKYKTTVRSFFGPQSDDAYMQIHFCDAQDRIQSVADAGNRKSVQYLGMWFLSELAWDMGEYGEYDVNDMWFPDNYLAHCAEGRYTVAELNAFTKNLLGVEFQEDNSFVQQNMHKDGKITLVGGVGGFAFVYDILDVQIGEEADTITVQHYNDVNKLIESVKVSYTIGHTGRICGCELLEDAKYAPFGILGAEYKYKGWQPMR